MFKHQSLLFFSLMEAKVKLVPKPIMETNMTTNIGTGLSASATKGANIVIPMANKSQIPTAVDRFKSGKIVGSLKLAYDAAEYVKFVPILAMNVNQGIILDRWYFLS